MCLKIFELMRVQRGQLRIRWFGRQCLKGPNYLRSVAWSRSDGRE